MGPASEYEDGVKGHKFASYQLILKDKNSDVSQKKNTTFRRFLFICIFQSKGEVWGQVFIGVANLWDKS